MGTRSKTKRQSAHSRPRRTAPLRPEGDPFKTITTIPSEIILGIVSPLGADNARVVEYLSNRLREYGYDPIHIRISRHIIPAMVDDKAVPADDDRSFDAAEKRMRLGNQIRDDAKHAGALSVAVMAEIMRRRLNRQSTTTKAAYIVSSLKLTDEVNEFRKVYRGGFYLFGVHTKRDLRIKYLMGSDGRHMSESEAVALIDRDEHEQDNEQFGQNTRDTFSLSDFFLANEGNDDKLRYSAERCLDLIFGRPTITPTFNEFAMFMAFGASLRSADLSRQVGAVLARDNEILSNGANDCPSPGGGLYWPQFMGNHIDDVARGRDYKRGFDSNEIERRAMGAQILKALGIKKTKATEKALSPLKNLTEYGRMVHAEMEALTACARIGASSVGATLFCTTFPCHNCAKHIIAAGVKEVVYVEPYPKSKALEFHDDAITSSKKEQIGKLVRFKPFIGVAPRLFFDLFSMSLSSGHPLTRKTETGKAVDWDVKKATPRVQLLTINHREFEKIAAVYVKRIRGAEVGRAKKGKRTKVR